VQILRDLALQVWQVVLALPQKQERGRLVDKRAAAFLDARFNEVDDTQMVMCCQAKTVVRQKLSFR
jgi:hypothetical protein